MPDPEPERTAIQPQRETTRLMPGVVLNGIYRIDRRLGAGGMGEVYHAVNVETGEPEAIKVVAPALAAMAEAEALFRREARILRTLQSPAVAQLRLCTRDPALGVLYLVTEFVEGPSLAERLEGRPGGEREIVVLMRRVAQGLAAAHAINAVHRDISPDNILLPGGDLACAKIIDFGIAKDLDVAAQTIIGDGFAGKLGFVAPEQFGFGASKVGPWTDLYSLALVGLAFAAGRAPHMGTTIGEAIEIRSRPIDLAPVPPRLRPLFAAMLEPDWQRRIAGADAVIAALDALDAPPAPLSASPPPPPPEPAPEPPPPEPAAAAPRRRGKALPILGAVVAIAAGVGVVFGGSRIGDWAVGNGLAVNGIAPPEASDDTANAFAATPEETPTPAATATPFVLPVGTPTPAPTASPTFAEAPPEATPTGAPSLDTANRFYIVGLDPDGDNWLALRSAALGEGRRLRRMGPDTTFRLLRRRGDWAQVELDDGTVGWVAARYIACCAPEPGSRDAAD
jgi:serine/threonine protein kinase